MIKFENIKKRDIGEYTSHITMDCKGLEIVSCNNYYYVKDRDEDGIYFIGIMGNFEFTKEIFDEYLDEKNNINISIILAKKLAPLFLDDFLKNQRIEDFYSLEINVYGNGYIYNWNRIAGTHQFTTDIWKKSKKNPDILKKIG